MIYECITEGNYFIRDEEHYTHYETYLARYPSGLFRNEAKTRLAFIKNNKAQHELDFKSMLKISSNDKFFWGIKFSEKGGQLGYRVIMSATLFDKNGDTWSTTVFHDFIHEREFNIPPGGSYQFDNWFRGRNFIGGHILCDIRIIDVGGHFSSRTIYFYCND